MGRFLLAVEGIEGRSVYQINVEPSVVVVIKQRYARTIAKLLDIGQQMDLGCVEKSQPKRLADSNTE